MVLSLTATTGVAIVQAGDDDPLSGPVLTQAIQAQAAHKKLTQKQKAAIAVAFAYKHIGDWYRYGATGPHRWDCSGLAGGAWKAAGIKLPRTARSIYRSKRFKHIARKHLHPGDLIFFYGLGHVMIYVGKGHAIHAPHTGTKVKKIKLNKYEWRYYDGAIRPGA